MASTGAHQSDGRPGGGRRPSAAVYRRRRLAALILLLLVIAAVAVGAAFLSGALGGGARAADEPVQTGTSAASTPTESTPAPAPTPAATSAPATTSAPAPTATPSAAPSASAAAPTPGEGCADAVVVVGETDKPSYAAGEQPVLSLVVRNEGDEACEVNVGTSQMEFVVTSDDERVFSSVDCQADSQDLPLTIEPGGEERATFDWARNRTVPDCTVVEEEPAPGEYTLTTRLGARSSAPVDFTLQ